MTSGLTSIIVPTFNHAPSLGRAIASALGQTAPTEVVVVDDGSTDATAEVLDTYGGHIRVMRQPHAGVSEARNLGLTAARGEFVMFLDADDTLEPTKVADERAVLQHDPRAGWAFCDVRIEDELRKVIEPASVRYRYGLRDLASGWLRAQLASSNFIPIMAPLLRRALLGEEVRFGAQQPEDWHFWYDVATRGRARYVPQVLATYCRHRAGRHAGYTPPTVPGLRVRPVCLNLGCGTFGSPSWHPLPGCINLDRSMGWWFEDGLPQFATASVDGITISHALMYVPAPHWSACFREFVRVLRPGGVLRITEDDTEHPHSARLGGWHGSQPAITLTSPAQMRRQMTAAGLIVRDVTATSSAFADLMLCQGRHGERPHVFFVEGVNP